MFDSISTTSVPLYLLYPRSISTHIALSILTKVFDPEFIEGELLITRDSINRVKESERMIPKNIHNRRGESRTFHPKR